MLSLAQNWRSASNRSRRLEAAARRLPRPSLASRVTARIAVFTVAVLLLSGIIHLATIFLIPPYSPAGVWARLAVYAKAGGFAEVPEAKNWLEPVPGLDPLFVYGSCRVSLAASPVHLSFRSSDRFWSVALLRKSGSVFYSVNDRTAVGGQLDMTIADPVQSEQMRAAAPDDRNRLILVQSPDEDVIALLRLYAPTDAARTQARDILKTATCHPIEVPPAARPQTGGQADGTTPPGSAPGTDSDNPLGAPQMRIPTARPLMPGKPVRPPGRG
ncbi:Uncharacterized membrane protein [Faunimonas pinastri]|uniref:Uncharacterized membrane protein n=1 Tax=Faunimonas pinastri TaxID=1855383 RepID=A0A1H9M9E0_9HYPH|nr:DUF1254 domain-containing protein [Faunimonas pinastri]SER20298.1 Uncharacterized membrane protein [Faunimonas pinastri]